MDKVSKYEVLFVKFITMFYIFGIISPFFFYKKEDMPAYLAVTMIINILLVIMNITKNYLIRKHINSKSTLLIVVKILEISLLLLISKISFVYLWGYLSIIMILAITSFGIGHQKSIILSLGTTIVNLILSLSFSLANVATTFSAYRIEITYYFDILFGFCIVILTVVCSRIKKENTDTEQQNKVLVGEIEEKYHLLALAQQEIKNHYDKLKFSNKKLEESNLKLSNSIGEFYTLHQISTAISSILNIEELLRYVNDIMIGVMGVQYSTIAIYDEKKDMLSVHTTNIEDKDILHSLSKSINSEEILGTLSNDRPIVNNRVNGAAYAFTYGREVNSFICAPLISKTRKLGVVLIEHKLNNAFGEDKKRLIDIICQQVSIAMENAELYQKMHELAITDWLTGVYNRVHFQEVLCRELKTADENNHELCVCIVDIDLFKKFNDTYGHIFGDQVIKAVSETIKNSLKSNEVLARYGGEEFIILMPDTNVEEAYARMEVLREQIQNTIVSDDEVSVSVTASFGVAGYLNCALTDKSLLKNADAALYEAKRSGRNSVKVYSN